MVDQLITKEGDIFLMVSSFISVYLELDGGQEKYKKEQGWEWEWRRNLIKISTQLINVLEDSFRKPTVRVCVDEQLHVEHASDLDVGNH